MLAQAGVSLGLASEVAVKFPDWGRNFQTSIIAVVLINQFVGPVACKFALKSIFKEAGKMKEGEDAHGGEEGPHSDKVKRVLLIGVDLISLDTAQRLLDRGYAVTLMDSDRAKLALTSVLEAAEREIVGLERDQGEGGHGAKAEKKGKKRRKDDYASLEPLEAERQESVLVEDEGVEQGRSVEVEEGGDEEKEEEEQPDISVHTESRIETILIPPYATSASTPSSSASALVDTFTSLITPHLSSPLSSLHSALVFFPSDADTLTVSSLLTSTFHIHHVLARLHNSTWAPHAVSLGVVPLSLPSLSSQVVMRVLMDGEVDPVEADRVGEGRLNSLPHVFASFVGEGDERVNEWAMEKEERDEWLSAHPAWSEEVGGGVGFSQLKSAMSDARGVSMNVVPTALREDYLSRMLASHNAEDEGDVEGEMREATEAFLSPAAMREVERGDRKEAEK